MEMALYWLAAAFACAAGAVAMLARGGTRDVERILMTAALAMLASWALVAAYGSLHGAARPGEAALALVGAAGGSALLGGRRWDGPRRAWRPNDALYLVGAGVAPFSALDPSGLARPAVMFAAAFLLMRRRPWQVAAAAGLAVAGVALAGPAWLVTTGGAAAIVLVALAWRRGAAAPRVVIIAGAASTALVAVALLPGEAAWLQGAEVPLALIVAAMLALWGVAPAAMPAAMNRVLAPTALAAAAWTASAGLFALPAGWTLALGATLGGLTMAGLEAVHPCLHAARPEAGPGPTQSAPDVHPASAGKILLGRYRVTRHLGDGGLGRTYLAKDLVEGGVAVVLKVPLRRDEGAARIIAEAEKMQAIDHRAIVQIHGIAHEGDEAALVMEYVAGGSLADAIRSGVLARPEWETVAQDLLDGLQAIHAAGLVHQDIKPGNVLLTASGGAKVADFGTARRVGAEATVGTSTDHDVPVGTIRFMSPEQARGQRPMASSDVYSAAATLYEALTGEKWLELDPTESTFELRLRVARAKGYGRRFPRDDSALGMWFKRALAPRSADRFQAGDEALDALREALRG